MTAAQDPRFWHELPNAPAPGTVLGQVAALIDGQATMVTAGSTVTRPDGTADQPFRLLLLRSGTEVKAYVNRCAHFGVPLAARQEQLIHKPHISITCNVHYARYRWADGYCESGDCAGASLLAIPVAVNAAGEVCIAHALPT